MTWFARVPFISGALVYVYMGSKTALCSSTWPSCASTWALQTDLWSQETSKRLSRTSKSVPGRSQNHPQARNGPGEAKRLQDSPTGRQERPKSAPRAAQAQLPNGPGGEVGPNWHKRAVRRPPRDHFGPGVAPHSQSFPVGKACASLRPATLHLLV